MTNEQLLLNALKEARELVEHWGGYASAYFQEKWDLAGDLKKLDDVISAGEKCVQPAVEPTEAQPGLATHEALSRSVQRRVAAMKGEPAPTFAKKPECALMHQPNAAGTECEWCGASLNRGADT